MAKKEKLKPETEKEIVKDIEKSGVPEVIAKKEEKLDEKESEKFEKQEDKESKSDVSPEKKEKPKIKKKTEAVVDARNIPVSTKVSAAICNMIKGKKITTAVRELEEVAKLKKAVPMSGEIPHRKGKMGSGRYPIKAAKNFIVLLKSLSANANVNDIDEPIIVKAIANIASRPFGKFGRVRKKRTHIKIVAMNKISQGKTI